MSVPVNETLVRRAIEAIWNRGDLDAADQLFAAAYVNHYGLIADLVLGPEAIKISAALYHIAFPGLHISVEEVSTVEDTVVLRWTATTVPTDCVGAPLPRSRSPSQGSRAAAFLPGRSSRVGPNGIGPGCCVSWEFQLNEPKAPDFSL